MPKEHNSTPAPIQNESAKTITHDRDAYETLALFQQLNDDQKAALLCALSDLLAQIKGEQS